MATIGFIGLGHMGAPMVHNLLAAQHEVIVYDVNALAMRPVVEAGAVAAENLAAVAKAPIIFTMLQIGEQVKDVCVSEDGLFKHAHKETLFIDSSSIDIVTCRQLHRMAEEHGFKYLDAPVSGGVASAQAAGLTFMVGGDPQVFAEAKPILQVMGKKIVHAGSAGDGQAAKICNNMILGVSMIAISEAFILAEKLGLSAEKLFEISNNATGQCWAMSHNPPIPGVVENVPANHDYQAGFSASMMLKDLNLSQQAAQSVAAYTPLGQQATQIYTDFVEHGNGLVDFSAIIKLMTEPKKGS
ncbi:MAG: 3-hydroxyisobutyrate dehydrogenase [Gammaproteobacteria bacterium]